MTSRQKLLEHICHHPKGVTFEELESWLWSFGYELVRTQGSHHVYRRAGAPTITVARHKPHVHSAAVKAVLRAISDLQEES